MEARVYSTEGIESSDMIQLEDAVFNQTPHEHAMYQAVQAMRAHMRHGTHASKNRALVRGGGVKPFRQKGTGRARAGTIRSPLWRGGGRVFGPTPHAYAYRLPRKVKRLARISALSLIAKEGTVRVIEDFDLEAPKTKRITSILTSMNIAGHKVLFITKKTSHNVLLSCRNIPNLFIRECGSVSTYDILNCEYLVICKGAVEELNGLGSYERINAAD